MVHIGHGHFPSAFSYYLEGAEIVCMPLTVIDR